VTELVVFEIKHREPSGGTPCVVGTRSSLHLRSTLEHFKEPAASTKHGLAFSQEQERRVLDQFLARNVLHDPFRREPQIFGQVGVAGQSDRSLFYLFVFYRHQFKS
jgi:hypothetical protein